MRFTTLQHKATFVFRLISQNTADIVATGTLRLLEATREYIAMAEDPVVYQAGSSEMYGSAAPQSEATRLHPVLTLWGRWPVIGGRGIKAYGMYVANGILFNHESPPWRDICRAR